MLPFCCHRGLSNGEKPLFTGFFTGVMFWGKAHFNQRGKNHFPDITQFINNKI